jgi:hypothetical protein
MFLRRMIRIGNRNRERIAEDCGRFLKGNTVFPVVRISLLGVPLESQGHRANLGTRIAPGKVRGDTHDHGRIASSWVEYPSPEVPATNQVCRRAATAAEIAAWLMSGASVNHRLGGDSLRVIPSNFYARKNQSSGLMRTTLVRKAMADND